MCKGNVPVCKERGLCAGWWESAAMHPQLRARRGGRHPALGLCRPCCPPCERSPLYPPWNVSTAWEGRLRRQKVTVASLPVGGCHQMSSDTLTVMLTHPKEKNDLSLACDKLMRRPGDVNHHALSHGMSTCNLAWLCEIKCRTIIIRWSTSVQECLVQDVQSSEKHISSRHIRATD